MENVVDNVLSFKYNKFKLFFIKLILKHLPTVSTINADMSEEHINTKEGKRNYEYFKNIVKEYREKGYTKNDIIDELDKQFKNYNLNFENLPKLVYDLYDN